MPYISDEFFNYLTNNVFTVHDPVSLVPRSTLKVVRGNNGEPVHRIYPLDDIPAHKYILFQDVFKEVSKGIEKKMKRIMQDYNALVEMGTKVGERSKCNTDEDYKLCDAAHFLIKQLPHMKDKIEISEKIREETDEEKVERLKHEIKYYKPGYKPTAIKYIIKDENYGKWRELFLLTGRINRNKKRTRTSIIQNPGLIMEIIPGEPINVPEEHINQLMMVGKHIIFTEKYLQIIKTPNFIMEILPEQCMNTIVTPNFTMEILENGENPSMKKIPNFTMEILESKENPSVLEFITQVMTDNVKIINVSNILTKEYDTEITEYEYESSVPNINTISEEMPEDYEAESDPLKIITWKEFYHADKDIKEPQLLEQLTVKQWGNIDNVYKNLYKEKFRNKMSMREDFVLGLILNAYSELRRTLPEVKIL